MYAIAQVIYGLPLHLNSDNDDDWSDELEEAVEGEEDGFLTYYSGAGDHNPAAFGIHLCEFDEACDHIALTDLKLKPDEAQKEAFKRKLSALSNELRKEVTSRYSEPRTFILWSTS